MNQLINIVAFYAGLNGIFFLALSYNVGRHRDRTNSLTPGDMGDKVLIRAIRAHGNASEYIPFAMLMLLILALQNAPQYLLHILGVGFTFGRIAQAYGMMQDKQPNAIRFTGNLFTGLFYLIASTACIYFGFSVLL